MKKIKLLVRRLKARQRGYLKIENDEETLPDRLLNPQDYQERHLEEPTSINSTNPFQSNTY